MIEEDRGARDARALFDDGDAQSNVNVWSRRGVGVATSIHT